MNTMCWRLGYRWACRARAATCGVEQCTTLLNLVARPYVCMQHGARCGERHVVDGFPSCKPGSETNTHSALVGTLYCCPYHTTVL